MKAKISRANHVVLKMWFRTLQGCIPFILDYPETLSAKWFSVYCLSDVGFCTVYNVRI